MAPPCCADAPFAMEAFPAFGGVAESFLAGFRRGSDGGDGGDGSDGSDGSDGAAAASRPPEPYI